MDDFGRIIVGLIMAVIYFWLNSRKKAKSTGAPSEMISPERPEIEDERLGPQLDERKPNYTLEEVLREFDEMNIRRQKKKEEKAKRLVATPMIKEVNELRVAGQPSKTATKFFNIEQETRRHLHENTPKIEPRPETWAEKIQDPELLRETIIMREILEPPISMR